MITWRLASRRTNYTTTHHRTILALHSGDYPALCKLHKGQGVSSSYGCLFCFLRGVYTHSGQKMLWAQFRRWLPIDHPWRHDTRSFGSQETRLIPIKRTVASMEKLGVYPILLLVQRPIVCTLTNHRSTTCIQKRARLKVHER